MGNLVSGNKRILIKTYAHDSGLWYLGESLCDALVKEGHQVAFIPKSKYIKINNSYRRDYLIPNDREFYIFKSNLRHEEQVVFAIKDFKADILISLETLMQNHTWISYAKGAGTQVIDIPMLEWVTPTYFENKKYGLFNEIWAVNKNTFNFFSMKYPSTKIKTWDFVNRNIFFDSKIKSEKYRFYHQASLSEFSHKNTEEVIKAFNSIFQKYPKTELHITGKIKKQDSDKLFNSNKGIIYHGILDRASIANLYRNVDCVVAPSLKEGLGLSLYEAQASGCKIITSDAAPMNEIQGALLCRISKQIKNNGYVPISFCNHLSIEEQMIKAII